MGDSEQHLQKLSKYVKQLGGAADSLAGYVCATDTARIRGDPRNPQMRPYSTAAHTTFAKIHILNISPNFVPGGDARARSAP